MLAAVWMNVVDNDEVLSVLVALLRMIPKNSRVLDVLAAFVDQHVIDGDDAMRVKFRIVQLLQPVDASLVHGVLVPRDFGEETVEARLIGGVWHFVGYSGNGFVFGNHQAGEVIGEVFPLWIVFEQGRKKPGFHGKS